MQTAHWRPIVWAAACSICAAVSSTAYCSELKVVVSAKKGDATVSQFIADFQKANGTLRISPIYMEGSDLALVLEKKPDLYIGASGLVVDNLSIGIFSDISKLLPANLVKDILPGFVAANSVGARLFAVPVGGQSSTILYNRAHFKAAGLPTPDGTWTWEGAFYAACRKLSGAGKFGVTGLGGGFDFSSTVPAYGGRYVDKGLKKVQYAEKSAMQAINFVLKLHKEKLADLTDYSAINRDDPKTWPFFNGTSSMTNGPLLPATDAEIQAFLKGRGLTMDLGWTFVPRGPKGSVPTIDSQVISVFSTSKNKQGAAAFLKFMCSTKGQLIFKDQKYLPCTFSSLKDPKVQKLFGPKFIANYQGGRARELKNEARQVEGMLWNDVRKIVTGEGTLQELLDNAKGQATDLLSNASYDF